MNRDKIKLYNQIKEDLKKEFLFVSGTKNKVFDLMCWGFSADTFVKLLYPDDLENKNFYINYLIKKSKKAIANKLYLIIIIDKNYKEVSRELLEIN